MCKGESRQLSQKTLPRPQKKSGQRNVSTGKEARKPETRSLTYCFFQRNCKAFIVQKAKPRNCCPQPRYQMGPVAWCLLHWGDRSSVLFPRKDTKPIATAFLFLQPKKTKQFYSRTVHRNIPIDGKNLLSISHRANLHCRL